MSNKAARPGPPLSGGVGEATLPGECSAQKTHFLGRLKLPRLENMDGEGCRVGCTPRPS